MQKMQVLSLTKMKALMTNRLMNMMSRLKSEDFVSAEHRIMSGVVLELLLKMTPQLHTYLTKTKLPALVMLNVIFSYFAQALLPHDYQNLVTAMMGRENLKKLIQEADPDGMLFKRRYVWNYTESPQTAFPDQPIVPNVATVINTSLSVHPDRVKWKPSEPDLKTTEAEAAPKSPTSTTESKAQHDANASQLVSPSSDRSTATPDAYRVVATELASKRPPKVEVVPKDVPVTSIGSSAIVKTDPQPIQQANAAVDRLTVHTDAVDVDSMVKSISDNPDTLSIQKSIVVNEEFEKVFGWTQSDIRAINIRRSTMGIWSLSKAFHQFRQCRNDARIKQRTLASDSRKAKKLLRQAEENLKKDIQRLWLQHHQASVQGITQFSQQVVMVSKTNGMLAFTHINITTH